MTCVSKCIRLQLLFQQKTHWYLHRMKIPVKITAWHLFSVLKILCPFVGVNNYLYIIGWWLLTVHHTASYTLTPWTMWDCKPMLCVCASLNDNCPVSWLVKWRAVPVSSWRLSCVSEQTSPKTTVFGAWTRSSLAAGWECGHSRSLIDTRAIASYATRRYTWNIKPFQQKYE